MRKPADQNTTTTNFLIVTVTGGGLEAMQAMQLVSFIAEVQKT